MKIKSVFLLSLFAVLFSSCQPGLGDVLKMTYGASREIPSEGLEIIFLDVMDSRCPTGVQCIAPGEARVTLDVQKDSGARQVVELTAQGLCEDATGPCGSEADAMGYRFKLLFVAPYPAKDAIPAKENYVLTLVVDKSL